MLWLWQDVEMTYGQPLPPNPNSVHCQTNWGLPSWLRLQIRSSQIRGSKGRGFAVKGLADRGLEEKGLGEMGLGEIRGLVHSHIPTESILRGLCRLTVGRWDWEVGLLLTKAIININIE